MGKIEDDSEDKFQINKLIHTPRSNSVSSKSFNSKLKQVKDF